MPLEFHNRSAHQNHHPSPADFLAAWAASGTSSAFSSVPNSTWWWAVRLEWQLPIRLLLPAESLQTNLQLKLALTTSSWNVLPQVTLLLTFSVVQHWLVYTKVYRECWGSGWCCWPCSRCRGWGRAFCHDLFTLWEEFRLQCWSLMPAYMALDTIIGKFMVWHLPLQVKW